MAVAGARSSGASLVLVFRTAIVDADGRRVDTRLVPLALALGRAARCRTRADLRAIVEGALRARAADIDARLARDQRARLGVLVAGRADALARPLARERALGATARAALARAIVQPGLFDTRALARAARARTDAEGWRAESDARVRDLEAGLRLDGGPVELVAAVVLPAAPGGTAAAT